MSDVSVRSKPRNQVRRNRSIYQVHYGLLRRVDREMARPLHQEPLHLRAYDLQVAGHCTSDEKRYLGVLQCNNGTILKPILKPTQKREVDFYTRLLNTKNPELVELKAFVPEFYGVRKFTYNGYEQEYVVLRDLAERMLEPCIMDVKIGKRTYDPLATEEKIQKEKSKYAQCKEEFGFCIPGYQVSKLASGKLHKYGKEHGKKLHGAMVRAAIRNYLNGMGSSLCRALILQFLSQLWKIQKWAGRQTAVRLYSASLLLVYDAAKLRECCGDGDVFAGRPCVGAPMRRRAASFHATPAPGPAGASFSGQLTARGPTYKKVNSVPITPMSLVQSSFSPPSPISSPWTEALEKLNHNHSFEHNYEDKLSKIKMNYRALLDQLASDEPTPSPWGTVKIIDFVHAFFNEDEEGSVDENFKEGIDNFVEIFEYFLRETDDQVF